MAVQIGYMGAKHGLAPIVGAVVAELPRGPFLDLFAGMCSVAGQIAPSRRETWCNDVQRYAALVARALISSPEPPPTPVQATTELYDAFARNLRLLKARFGDADRREGAALKKGSGRALSELTEEWRHAGNDPKIATEVRRQRTKRTSPYRLATLTFAFGYFGLRQSMELDSLRFAIDEARNSQRVSPSQARWLLVALLQTASHVTSGPGHFAEFLSPTSKEGYQRVRRARARPVWRQFLVELDRLGPYGTAEWRKTNHVYCQSAKQLGNRLGRSADRPMVVYADPPYSRAQYSRYYHVLETLTRYDYPDSIGVGRYRPDRFQTTFSLASSVEEAIEDLAATVASFGACLVLSYPSNGLLYEVGGDVETSLRDSYRCVRLVYSAATNHSTMGSGPGRAHTEVDEMIFVATRPRN